MIKRVAHIGIAVSDLDEAVRTYSDLLEKNPKTIEEVSDQRVKAAIFDLKGGRLELLAGTDPESPISIFVEQRGQGIHHICFEVDKIEAEIERLVNAGIQMIDEAPREGAEGALVAFIHPRSTAGVLVELRQKK